MSVSDAVSNKNRRMAKHNRKTRLNGACMGDKYLQQALLLCCLALTSGVATAHHSVANFDMDKTIKIEGTVERLEWTNPHMWLWVVVTDASGATQEWGLEAASPANMTRRAGWNKRAVNPGDKVTVDLHPFRDGKPGGSLAKVTLPDGRVLGTGGAAATSENNAK